MARLHCGGWRTQSEEGKGEEARYWAMNSKRFRACWLDRCAEDKLVMDETGALGY